MLVNVSGKVVVVTGSSRGIGKEIIRKFAKENAKVVINFSNAVDKATELYNEILEFNENCILVQADVTKQEDVSKLYYKTIEAFGRVDVLINNAGACDDNRIQLMRQEQWDRIIGVNLKGTYLCSKVFSKKMIQQRSGKIINIASLKGQEGYVGQVNYSASKAGIIGFTKALAKELGVFNIAVNAVCPGFIVTDLNRNNSQKLRIAQNRSLLPVDHSLDDLLDYLIFISSDKLLGISGRVFNLDSRVI